MRPRNGYRLTINPPVLVTDLPPWLLRLFAFVFGAAWGSFFNVAIYRWPRDMSVVTPKSHCPSCGKPVPAWHNVPILGFLLLKGRAACCGVKLSGRYLLVEILGAAIAVALCERYIVAAPEHQALLDASILAVLFFAFAGGLIIATFVDLEWMEIPDEVSIGGTALGLATASLRPGGASVEDLAIGAGGGFLLVQVLLVWTWERLTGRRGMGEGDAKLLMFIGAFLGWKGALFALVAGAIQGIVVAMIALATGMRTSPAQPEEKKEEAEGEAAPSSEAPVPIATKDGVRASISNDGRELEIKDARGRLLWEWRGEDTALLKRAIPFGPFLALGAFEFLFFGDPIVETYLSIVDSITTAFT
jgi:leader peptidase (prepilin peptidase) / N-methyltransferase